MVDNTKPTARRSHSSARSRLKPASYDALESIGLPSKGETKLNDFKAQEQYYKEIVDRWKEVCANAGDSAGLERQFATLTLPSSASTATGENNKSPSASEKVQKCNGNKASNSPNSSAELATILLAMRKLREATVAMSRKDIFTQKAYMFMIRTAILLKNMESYHPALLHLLHHIHPRCPLLVGELQEFVGYHILDLACRQRDYFSAYVVKQQFKYQDRQVDKVLEALMHDNWVIFWLVKSKVDGHIRALMEWADDNIRLHALKCLGRSYFTADKTYVERCVDMCWDELVDKMHVGWQLEGEKVTIRHPKSTR